MSYAFLASEKAILIGYQYSQGPKSRMQLGLGYTKGIFFAFGSPGGYDPNIKNKKFSSGTIEAKVIRYFISGKVRSGLNFGVNVIIWHGKVLPGMNIGFICGIL